MDAAGDDEAGAHFAGSIRADIRDRMMLALLDIPVLADPRARAMLVELVAEAVGHPLVLREQPSAGLQLLELFRACQGIVNGVSVLVRSVESMVASGPQVDPARRLAEEWTALHAVPELTGMWPLLSETLGRLSLTRNQRIALFQEATDGQLTAPPRHSDTPWSDLVHLAGRNAVPGRLPPWMLYLERCAFWMEPPTALELRARNRKIALKWQFAPQLDRARFVDPVHRQFPVRRHEEYLAIQFSPDRLQSGHYSVSHLFLTDARDRGWEPGDTIHRVPLADLEQVVSRLVSQVEQVNGDRSAHLRLEFVLPMELLNLPVDCWPRDMTENPQVPLALDYSVVVRSLDRLQHGDWHRKWRNRWEQLRVGEPLADSVHIVNARKPLAVTSLEAVLSEERLVALVLSEPPVPDRVQGCRELQAALRSGLPVIIWHRSDCSTREFRRALNDLLAEGLQRLPNRLAAFRRQAAGSPTPEGRKSHIGSNLTVLWDDPDRKPEAAAPF